MPVSVGTWADSYTWNPTYIPSVLALYLDGSDSTTITHSGGLISQWRDKSGFNRHFNQSGAPATKPLTGFSSTNGRNTVFFANANSYLIGPVIPLSIPFTISAVVTSETFGNQARIIGYGDTFGAPDFGLFFGRGGTSPLIGGFEFIQVPGVWTNGFPRSMIGVYNAGSSVLSWAGANPGVSGDTTFSTASKPMMIAGQPTGSSYWLGTIGELIISDGAMDETTRRKLNSYFKRKWNL